MYAVSTLVDLWRRAHKLPAQSPPLEHPAGVTLPFDASVPPDIIVPELRAAISSGDYAADVVRLLPWVLRQGDRVLVVGDGFGMTSTLIAKSGLASAIIVAEPDPTLFQYLNAVHMRNDVSSVETMDAFPAVALNGRVPYFVRRDPRQSSLRPDDGASLRVSMTPRIDLDLLLADAQINLVIWSCAPSAASTLADADLGPVDRILLVGADEFDTFGGEVPATELLQCQEFACSGRDGAVLLKRGG